MQLRTAPLPFRSARAVPTEGLPPASDGVPKRSCAPQGFQRSVTEAMYDYFYGAEAEQFSFYRIPKVLFTEERFRSVSAEAKVLYGLLLDRMSLSCKNGWLDKEGRVYIIFTIEEVMTALGCADQKAGKLLHELESKCRLIERKRQGLGKPNLIYVKNFVDKDVDNTSGSSTPSPESRFQNRENHDSGAVKITDQESLKSRSNNTENNDTDFTAGLPIPIPVGSRSRPLKRNTPPQKRGTARGIPSKRPRPPRRRQSAPPREARNPAAFLSGTRRAFSLRAASPPRYCCS